MGNERVRAINNYAHACMKEIDTAIKHFTSVYGSIYTDHAACLYIEANYLYADLDRSIKTCSYNLTQIIRIHARACVHMTIYTLIKLRVDRLARNPSNITYNLIDPSIHACSIYSVVGGRHAHACTR